ncbi:unnamed protein product [Echinostoma caproni]|uniref:Exonuclease domain-containing protein n=1 Tax=Echinostoma caproni TaxID=27848 RepID=A0A183A7D8_9TREM|nr:unnamed protein product [Echinostoma caproni]
MTNDSANQTEPVFVHPLGSCFELLKKRTEAQVGRSSLPSDEVRKKSKLNLAEHGSGGKLTKSNSISKQSVQFNHKRAKFSGKDAHHKPTRRIAIDCEFVGVGFEGKENALARVSIVNQFGHVLLDSGILRRGIQRAFKTAIGTPQRNVLMLSHPRRHIRDTSRYRPFRALFGGRTPSLRALTERVLGVSVQTGEHDSIEDARAAMRLYTSVKRVWESRKKGRESMVLGLLSDVKSSHSADKPGAESGQEQHQQLDILTEYEVR